MNLILEQAKLKAAEIVKDRKGCPEFPYFGARYPDATCIEGELYDLDKCDENGLLYSTGDNPICPFCNPEQFIQDQHDDEADLEKSLEWLQKTLEKYN